MNLLIYLLYKLIHFLVNLYCLIRQPCLKLCSIVEHCVYACKALQNYLRLENAGDNLASKLPKHIAILSGLEEISLVDMTSLIEWCITAHIPYISFYDHKGLMQKNFPLIEKKLKQKSSYIFCDTDCLRDSKKVDDNTQINEVSSIENHRGSDLQASSKVKNESIKIQLLSYLDGKSKIVSLTKKLSIAPKWTDERDITSQVVSQELNSQLNGNVKVPEPDLALVFGKTMCSYGFLPWHSRITEFFLVPTHCGLLFDDLSRILIKYSKCQQHYGK